MVGRGSGNTWLDFGGDQDPDPGFVKKKNLLNVARVSCSSQLPFRCYFQSARTTEQNTKLTAKIHTQEHEYTTSLVTNYQKTTISNNVTGHTLQKKKRCPHIFLIQSPVSSLFVLLSLFLFHPDFLMICLISTFV